MFGRFAQACFDINRNRFNESQHFIETVRKRRAERTSAARSVTGIMWATHSNLSTALSALANIQYMETKWVGALLGRCF